MFLQTQGRTLNCLPGELRGSHGASVSYVGLPCLARWLDSSSRLPTLPEALAGPTTKPAGTASSEQS